MPYTMEFTTEFLRDADPRLVQVSDGIITILDEEWLVTGVRRLENGRPSWWIAVRYGEPQPGWAARFAVALNSYSVAAYGDAGDEWADVDALQ